MNGDGVRIAIMTAPNPGAVGFIQLHGPGAAAVAETLTGKPLPLQLLRLVDFSGIDEGLAVALRDDWVQLMPHGGMRVMRRIVDRLIELGASPDPEPNARATYPEAESDVEADMLAAIARAASPGAIDRLAEQPALWRAWLEQNTEPVDTILQRTARWERLIDAPSVVVVGAPNVGKSTLTNVMLGRSASIVADLPGTTRDWVAGLAEIGPVAVRWMDTPGLRSSDDAIEQQAIALAGQVIEGADVLIAMRDGDHDWPALPRVPDVRVQNKIDRSGVVDKNVIGISAKNGTGSDELEAAVIASLGLSDIDRPGLWAFSVALRQFLSANDREGLSRYVGATS